MFTKVLVSEDMDDINKGVYTALKELDIAEIDQVQYCDDAYLKIKKAVLDEQPYDLLISDLSFTSDYRKQKYPSGEALIQALQVEHPNLKVIVFSVEDRLQRVRSLVNDWNINAYVCKSRQGLKELAKAVFSAYNDTLYLSPEVAHALSPKLNLEIEDYDIELVRQLSNGLSHDEISDHFKMNNYSPSSLSTIEKRLNKLRIQFKANNAIHLVAIVKDLGLI